MQTSPKALVLLVEWRDRQWLLPILPSSPIRIGRSSNNPISVEDSQLAPRHIKIIPLGPEVWAKDLGSPEGFRHNGKLVREALLNPGDELTVGQIKASLLFEERSMVLPAPEPLSDTEPLELAFRPARAHSGAPSFRPSALLWFVILVGLVAVGVAGFSLYRANLESQEEQRQNEIRQARRHVEETLQQASDWVKQSQYEDAKKALSSLPKEDPELRARILALEKEIQFQEESQRKNADKAGGDEYLARYLDPLLSSSQLQSDVRWELIAWRRCDEFLKLFPKHPRAPWILAKRKTFSGGEKSPPAPTLPEVEMDVKDLLDSKMPNFAKARSIMLEFSRQNLGSAEDLKARETVSQIDQRAELFLKKELDAVQSAWKAGDTETATRTLNRLEKEIGSETLVKKVKDFRAQLK